MQLRFDFYMLKAKSGIRLWIQSKRPFLVLGEFAPRASPTLCNP